MSVFRADPTQPSIDQPYIKLDVLPDSKFWTMICTMQNPPEWAIYFGLIKKEDRELVQSVHLTPEGTGYNFRR